MSQRLEWERDEVQEYFYPLGWRLELRDEQEVLVKDDMLLTLTEAYDLLFEFKRRGYDEGMKYMLGVIEKELLPL